jgi:hypothetical protein
LITACLRFFARGTRADRRLIGSLQLIVVLLGLGSLQQTARGQTAGDASVPIDSWVYAAMDRLEAKGLVHDAYLGLRPWRRKDCLQMVEEAERSLQDEALRQEFEPLILQLKATLQDEPDGGRAHIRLDEVQQRTTAVAGIPLNDSFHFAQTLPNESGRSYARGLNSFTEMTLHGTAGPFLGFVQGELQRVSDGPQLNATAQPAIALADFTPVAQLGPGTSFLRGRILEAYGALSFHGNQVTMGRQALWWGPARSSATLFTDNAEPIDMFRYDRTSAIHLPGPLGWLGGVRAQLLIGRLSGTQFVHADHITTGVPGKSLSSQPWIHAEKVSFHPSSAFEFSVSRSVLFAGQGAPFTTHSLLKSYFSSGTGDEQNDPGDRRDAFDAHLRVNRCLSTYVDTFTDDEPFPLAYVKESAWIVGVSLTCAPRTKKLSLRAEGLVSPHRDILPGFYYFNVHYLSGYTQQRQIIGSWIGREGKGSEVWATWNASHLTTFEASVRTMNVDHEFLQGGSLQDLRLVVDRTATNGLGWRAEMQGERWNFPLLHHGTRSNGTFTLELLYRPAPRLP